MVRLMFVIEHCSDSHNGPFNVCHRWENSADSEEHPVVATAKGTFDSKGGVLESKETG